MHDVIYLAFEHTAKPIYLAHLEFSGGDSWAVLGSDFSAPSAWRSLALDTTHMQVISLHTPLLCVRFVLHMFRSGEYTVENFQRDLIARSKISIS